MLKTMHQTHQISHIFLTDGEVTNGENDPNKLKQFVVKDIYNYFIGYGSDHDSKLLGILSDFEKSSYHYVDAIEKAGFVFGEILHNITHKLLYNCEIVVEHGVIYNYNTNLYTNRLFIGDIVGESNKVYHLFTDTPTTCYVHLKTIEPLEIHMFQETEHDLSFVNYAFRHRTLTLLGEVKECQEKYEGSPRFGNEGYFSSGNISDCKMKMSKLFDEMIKYMEDNNDKQNKFIKMLCDDIHISQKTLGTKYGRMCISSRQTSQGTQRIYTVNTTPLDRRRQDSDSDDDVPQRSCQRASLCQRSSAPRDSDSDEEIQRSCAPKQRASLNLAVKIDDYEVSNECMEDSPYLTRTATTVMRSISYVSSSGSEKSDSEKSEAEDIEAEDIEAEADDLIISP